MQWPDKGTGMASGADSQQVRVYPRFFTCSGGSPVLRMLLHLKRSDMTETADEPPLGVKTCVCSFCR
jgi:hypothetical protein